MNPNPSLRCSMYGLFTFGKQCLHYIRWEIFPTWSIWNIYIHVYVYIYDVNVYVYNLIRMRIFWCQHLCNLYHAFKSSSCIINVLPWCFLLSGSYIFSMASRKTTLQEQSPKNESRCFLAGASSPSCISHV